MKHLFPGRIAGMGDSRWEFVAHEQLHHSQNNIDVGLVAFDCFSPGLA